MSSQASGTKTVIVRHPGSAGLATGIFGCLLGLLGIFTIGIVFVPLAAVCALSPPISTGWTTCSIKASDVMVAK